ncbi:iron-containing redox enzyme family protein [Photorhabdus luminescens]|nr:iron-containing redox enzyme family protein [Photorhabdus luminescens]
METLINEINNKTQKIEGLSSIWVGWFQEDDLLDLVSHPLLQALEHNETDLTMLRTLLIQHSHYSRHFTRYLCALMGQLDNAEDLMALMENMQEEMGVDGSSSITHAEMFQRTLRLVGAVPNSQKPLPQTQTMIDTMMKYCQSSDSLVGLAAMCLGAEAIVPLIYKPILHSLRHFGFGQEATEFFSLHIEEDEDHALTMLAIMQRQIKDLPVRRSLAVEIGRELVACRVAMFDAILEQCRVQPATHTADKLNGHFSSADFWQVSGTLQAK